MQRDPYNQNHPTAGKVVLEMRNRRRNLGESENLLESA